MKDICVFAAVVGLFSWRGDLPRRRHPQELSYRPLVYGRTKGRCRGSATGVQRLEAEGTAASQRGRDIYKLMKKRKRLKMLKKKMNGRETHTKKCTLISFFFYGDP